MEKESVLYFSHDANARNDNKILELRAYMGWEGYGLYFGIIEILREQTSYNYPSNAKAGLAVGLNTPIEKLEQLLDICFQNGLFIESDDRFYSESLMNRMCKVDEKRAKRAEAGRKGGKASVLLKQEVSNAKAKSSKLKESKVKESKVKESKVKREVKGTGMIQRYIEICPFYNDQGLQDVWEEWHNTPKMKKCSKTPRAMEARLWDLMKHSMGSIPKAIKVVEKAADKGWTSLYSIDVKQDGFNNQRTLPSAPKKPSAEEILREYDVL